MIRLHKAGRTVMELVELTGLSWQAVNRRIDGYEADGAASLNPRDRGRPQGDGRSLSAAA